MHLRRLASPPTLLAVALLAGCPSGHEAVPNDTQLAPVPPSPQAVPAAVRAAADRGASEAAFRVGTSLEARADHAGAAPWMTKAATQGYGPAQARLGSYFMHGLGVKEDRAVGFGWAKRAADQGDAEGAYQLGAAYWQGLGIAPDGATALAWYRKAAAKHHGLAELQLGVFYADGILVKADRREARTWFDRAAADGQPDARETARLKLDLGLVERILTWLGAT